MAAGDELAAMHIEAAQSKTADPRDPGSVTVNASGEVIQKLDGQVAESSEVLVQDEEEIKREEEVMGSSQLGNLRQLARQTLADTKREVSAMNDEARAGTYVYSNSKFNRIFHLQLFF